MRVLVGVGAWFVGVGAATGGSLLAVSLLGQGIAASTTQQLTEAAVTRALGTEATEAQPGVLTASGPAATPSGRRSHTTYPPTTPPPQSGASPSDPPSARLSPSHSRHATPSVTPTPASNPTPTPTQTPSPSTVFTSQGGTVVAECLPGGAYLVSWSPTQGYEIGPVVRGPASTAQVKFESPANSVTIVVSCSTGVPTATTTVSPGNGSPTRTDE
jgi:hypothetical protein